jgi:hypothetical protein
MPENHYTVMLEDDSGKGMVELPRFDLDEKYHHLILNIISYLMDKGYDVSSSTHLKKTKTREPYSYFEIFFKSKKKTGFFKNKIKYGKTHTLWIGYEVDKPIMNKVIFILDGNKYMPNPALKEIYRIAGNRE